MGNSTSQVLNIYFELRIQRTRLEGLNVIIKEVTDVWAQCYESDSPQNGSDLVEQKNHMGPARRFLTCTLSCESNALG